MSSNIQRYGDAGVNTVEGNVAGSRAARLAKQREKEKQEYEAQRQAIESEHAKAGALRAFQGHSDHLEEEFKRQTVGLVTNDEFKRRRIELQLEDKKDKERDAAANDKKPKIKKRKKKVALSFAEDEDEESPESPTEDKSNSNGLKASRVSKDPDVETDFLPDSERERQLELEKERLKEEWKRKQEEIKKELLTVTYSYWDGSGHRREVTVAKGTTILKFLEKVRQELSQEFPELRGVSPENLMYIKEDLIIPHHYSFYDLIVTKARGKSGPLFHFDVHDDVRLIHDARVEKDESHPGKITERRWYERNKHIFPASRWEVYDPSVKRGKYTIHGD